MLDFKIIIANYVLSTNIVCICLLKTECECFLNQAKGNVLTISICVRKSFVMPFLSWLTFSIKYSNQIKGRGPPEYRRSEQQEEDRITLPQSRCFQFSSMLVLVLLLERSGRCPSSVLTISYTSLTPALRTAWPGLFLRIIPGVVGLF